MVQVLAVDPVSVVMWVVNLLASAAITITLWRLTAGQRKREREADRKREAREAREELERQDRKQREEERAAEVAALRKDLHTTAEKLVDARFREMSHSLQGSISGLLLTVDTMKMRLAESEKDLEGIGERDHSREIQILQGLAQIKQHLAEQGATKTDLKEHQQQMSGRVDQLQTHLVAQDARLVRIEQQVADKRRGA